MTPSICKGNAVAVIRNAALKADFYGVVLGFVMRDELMAIVLRENGQMELCYLFNCYRAGQTMIAPEGTTVPLSAERALETLEALDGKTKTLEVKEAVKLIRKIEENAVLPSGGRGHALDHEPPTRLSTKRGKLTGAMTRYLESACFEYDARWKRDMRRAEMALRNFFPRQSEVWNWHKDGLSNQQISSLLGISETTVSQHKSKALDFLYSRVQRPLSALT